VQRCDIRGMHQPHRIVPMRCLAGTPHHGTSNT
jgi:hypothetical protein